MSDSGFFAIGRDTFNQALGLGIAPAAAFLVMARGSAGDNVATNWSAESVSDRLGMRWKSAKAAIDQLRGARLAVLSKGSTRPAYTLAKKGDLVWLPNALVDGVGAEIPPISRIRQTHDPLLLRLLIDLYHQQNLREDGGVDPALIWLPFERERVGQSRGYIVWRFESQVITVKSVSPLVNPHRVAGDSQCAAFFRRFDTLLTMGLVEWATYLVDGPNGEPIHIFSADSGIAEERQLYLSCEEAAYRCLTERQGEIAAEHGGHLAPVLTHIEQVQMLGIARLRYRPKTSLTAAWWANTQATYHRYRLLYDELAT